MKKVRLAAHRGYMAKYPENIIDTLRAEHTVYTVDGGRIAAEIGNSRVLNSVVLGLAARHIGFTEDEWLAVLRDTVPSKTVEINTLAFLKGYNS